MQLSSQDEELRRTVREDESLEVWRRLGDAREKGFFWENGLLLKRELDELDQPVMTIVLPKGYRERVMVMAHVKGARHCRSCPKCQMNSRASPRKAPMQERDRAVVPFETVAIDLVGPFEKEKGGAKYLLTYMCIASKWPEAVPLKSMTARAVVEALVEIFSRNGIPYTLLTDQGAQLTGKVMSELCKIYGIKKIQTTPYHPQSNGVVERFHGTLVPMLRKASENKLEWTKQVPLALYAVRLAPHADTGISPFQYVHGQDMHSALDILHHGWLRDEDRQMNVSAWVEELVERLELLREKAVKLREENSKKRKERLDKGAVLREFRKGDQILLRTPGMVSKLEESWTGPWEVVLKCGPVTYRIKKPETPSKGRVVHLNTMKKYEEREESIRRLTVAIDDNEDELGGKQIWLSWPWRRAQDHL